MSDIYNQQFTIPYATNIEILTGSDFTIDSREKIYLTDGKSSTRYVILFYREKDADIQKLRAIQKIFIETGKVGFQDVSFKVCNLSTDVKLNTAFNDVRNTPAHPFNWIQNAADPNIFILIYFSGYPQMFYEGPLEKVAFTNFINTFLLGELESKTIFKKYNSGNGFIGVGSKQTYIEQAWSKYTPSGGVTVANALIKPENIPTGIKAIASGEYIGPPPTVSSTQYSQLPSRNDASKTKSVTSWKNKIEKKSKGDKGDMKIVADKIPTVFENSPYIDYLVSLDSKKGDNITKNFVDDTYEVAKKLNTLKGGFGITENDVANLAVNMYGFYKFKEADPNVKVETAAELEAVYISQNIVSKFVNVQNEFVQQQISKVVANTILSDDGTIRIANKILPIFNNKTNSDAGRKNLDLEDAKIIVNYFKDKMEELVSNEENRGKSKEDKKEIKRDVDNYDISSDESFPFRNMEITNTTNIQLENLIENQDNIKRSIIAAILKDEANPQQQGGQQPSGGGGNVFGSGRKNRRDND